MIEKDIKEKTIQWLLLENEVINHVIKKIDDKEISYSEWIKFFVDSVKTYGNEVMLIQLKMYAGYLKSIKSFYKFNEVKYIDEFSKEMGDLNNEL